MTRVNYSEKLADAICDALMNGKSMREICKRKGYPDRSTVARWRDADPAFDAKCARAREEQADYMDDLILETAAKCTERNAKASKVKISAYQWRAEKLKPKVYGNLVTNVHTGKDGGPIETNNKHDMGASIAFALRKASKT